MLIDPTYVEVQKAIIRQLYRTGHFWDADFPDALNVGVADLDTLTLKDKPAKQAVESLQRFDLNYVAKGYDKFKRAPAFDGEVGPATLDLLITPRCPMPDFAPPPGASFDYGDPGLNRAVESMRATGSGGWPASGCDPDAVVKNVHAIRVRINTKGATQTQLGYFPQVCEAVAESYRDIGLLVRYILDNPSAQAEIVKLMANLFGGTIGWNEFPSSGSCRQIEGRLDIGYSPSDWWMFAELEGHETGHGVGLPHTRGGRMNPSILRTSNVRSWRGDPSESLLRRLYGGEPVVIPTPPTPVPPGPIPPTPPALPNIAIDFAARELRAGTTTYFLVQKPDFG